MKKGSRKEGVREAQVDPRQRPLFEGWTVVRLSAEGQAHRPEEVPDRETRAG